MAYISEEEINNIRNSADIVEIISDYVPLNKSGNDYVGICPFHEDHSPSMHVSTKLGIFKCFVCNTGGNVFSFVQKFENISYIEAVKKVAEKSGIRFDHNIENKSFSKYKDEFNIMDLSLKYYQNNLATQKGVKAKEYLLSRGIDDNIISEFKIGLSFDDNKLKEFLLKKEIDPEKCFDLGLLSKNGNEYYDTFQNRIMIPILDMQGNLAGYTARCYLQDEKNKYINSKETVIYKKSNIIFNYYNAKDIARLNKEIIIVEGNMDAISLSVRGIKNVCALMGVVISKTQIDALKKLGARVVLMLDNDNAGSLATLNVGNELYKEINNLYVVRLNGAKDPDEYIRKFGIDALKDNINHAMKFLDFKFSTLKEGKNLDNIEDLTSYVKEVISSLENADELEREIAINKICNEYHIDPDVIKQNLKPIEKPKIVTTKPIAKKKTRYDMCISKLLYSMLLNPKYYGLYQESLGYLAEKRERDVADLIGSYILKYNTISIASFLDYINKYEDLKEYVTSIIAENEEEDIAESEFYDILNTAMKCMDEIEIKELKEKIKIENDMNKKIELIEKLTELKKGCGNNEGN